jgi:hypothetical protein
LQGDYFQGDKVDYMVGVVSMEKSGNFLMVRHSKTYRFTFVALLLPVSFSTFNFAKDSLLRNFSSFALLSSIRDWTLANMSLTTWSR